MLPSLITSTASISDLLSLIFLDDDNSRYITKYFFGALTLS